MLHTSTTRLKDVRCVSDRINCNKLQYYTDAVCGITISNFNQYCVVVVII